MTGEFYSSSFVPIVYLPIAIRAKSNFVIRARRLYTKGYGTKRLIDSKS